MSGAESKNKEEGKSGGFLETLDVKEDIREKNVDDVADLIDALADDVTEDDIAQQNEILDRDVAEMKQFMDKAVSDGTLVDDTDENAEDGTILLKDKTGE